MSVEYTTEFPFLKDSLVDALDIVDTWNDDPADPVAGGAQLRIQGTVPLGQYIVGISFTWISSNISTPIMSRFTLDGSTSTPSYEEAEGSLEFPNANNYGGYQFPWTVTNESVDIVLQHKKKTAGADLVSVLFSNYWLQRVA